MQTVWTCFIIILLLEAIPDILASSPKHTSNWLLSILHRDAVVSFDAFGASGRILNPLRKPVPLYINFNFPIGNLFNSVGPLIPQLKTIILLNNIFSDDAKQSLLLFGRLAEEFYPETPEQFMKWGEPYSYKLLGTPSPSSAFISDNQAGLPKWNRLFSDQPNSKQITRMQFQSRLSKLPFKWPLFKNQTIAYSQLYDMLVDQNIQTMQIVGTNHGTTRHTEKPDFSMELVKLLSLEMKRIVFESLTPTRPKHRNRSESRAWLHKMFEKEQLSLKTCDNFLTAIFNDPEKKSFTKAEFGNKLSAWAGEFSDGGISFERFVNKLNESFASTSSVKANELKEAYPTDNKLKMFFRIFRGK